MGVLKKVSLFLIIASVGMLAVASYRYAKRSGLFFDYPEAQYLTEEEAAVRPVYSGLNKPEQAVYTALYRGMTDVQDKIPLPADMDGDVYSRVYQIVEKQEPEFFYLDSIYYTADRVREAEIVYRDLSGIDDRKAALESAVERACSGMPSGGDYDKVYYINEYLAKICSYTTGRDSDGYESTAYGCLVEGLANCEGYAKAFRLLASRAGVESAVVIGITSKGENHAWAQVKVGGEWYNTDPTWDDSDDGENEVRMMYFLCDDKDFSRTHTVDESLFKPFRCTSNKDNYFVRNGLYIDENTDPREILSRELSGGSMAVDLKFASQELYDGFKSRFIDGEEIFEVARDTGRFTASSLSLTLVESEEELCLTIKF
ncbi:MAG: hypothetical protein IJ071_09175 [Ruminococcus sp.]|nr:hypothetical protein [Ruminococcus sp.]